MKYFRFLFFSKKKKEGNCTSDRKSRYILENMCCFLCKSSTPPPPLILSSPSFNPYIEFIPCIHIHCDWLLFHILKTKFERKVDWGSVWVEQMVGDARCKMLSIATSIAFACIRNSMPACRIYPNIRVYTICGMRYSSQSQFNSIQRGTKYIFLNTHEFLNKRMYYCYCACYRYCREERITLSHLTIILLLLLLYTSALAGLLILKFVLFRSRESKTWAPPSAPITKRPSWNQCQVAINFAPHNLAQPTEQRV